MALKTVSSLVLALAVALTLAACGGDAPSSSGAATTATSTTAPAPVDQTTPAASATTQAPGTTATQPARRRSSTRAPAPAPTPAQPQTTATQAAPEPDPVPATTTRRAPEPDAAPEPAPEPEPAGTPIEELAVMHLVNRASPREYTQEGTVTGTFDGTMTLDATITNRGVVVEFVAAVEGGTIVGKGIARPVITGSPLAELQGRMAITGGTGRFAAIRGRGLTIGGKAKLDGTYARVRLAGTVTY